jgi:hypothetical protein
MEERPSAVADNQIQAVKKIRNEAGAEHQCPHGVGRDEWIGAAFNASSEKFSPENKTQVKVGAEYAGEYANP